MSHAVSLFCQASCVTIMYMRFIHVFVCCGTLLFFIAIWIPLYRYTMIYLPILLLLDIWVFFPAFRYYDKGAMNILMHFFWWVQGLIFLRSSSRSGIPGSPEESMFSCNKFQQILFQSSCAGQLARSVLPLWSVKGRLKFAFCFWAVWHWTFERLNNLPFDHCEMGTIRLLYVQNACV